MHFLFEFDNEQITYTLIKHIFRQWKKKTLANAVSIIAGIISCKWGLLGHLGGLHLFKQLAVGSRDLSQAEMKVTVVKPEQIHKIIIIFPQNGQKLPFLVKIVIF